VTLGWPTGATYQAFFNRGFVISQFISRYLDEHYPQMNRIAALKAFKADMTGELDNKIRIFLAGQVRTKLTDLLDEDAAGKGSIYAALFEFDDKELLEHLAPLVHVPILSSPTGQSKQRKTRGRRKRLRRAKRLGSATKTRRAAVSCAPPASMLRQRIASSRLVR
jgi:hypothetical protein